MIRKLLEKKLLGLIILSIATCLSISIGTSVFFASAAEHADAVTISANYLGNVDRSVEIHEQLIGTYQNGQETTCYGKEFTVYSDDFAGVYIDEQGLLNIAVISNSKIRSHQASRYGNQVIFKEVAFSYNYLQKIMNAVESIMDNYSINAVGIDDEENLVFIELREEGEVPSIIKHLRSEGLYDESAVKFEVDANATVQDNARGGDGIISLFQGDTIGAGGTIAVMAICNITGRIGVLTNEHVARVTQNNTTNDIFDGNWTFMGNNNMRGRNGGNIDAAFVPFANHANWTVTPHARFNTTNYTNIRLGNESHIVKGLPVRKIGQTTGITTGTINDANITFNSPSATKTNTFRYTNDSDNGDSGGPVYYDDGTNLHLIGIHMGNGSGGFLWLNTYGYACRITNVMRTVAQGGLDVTPITNSMFNPTLNGSTVQVNNIGVPTETTHVTIPNTMEGRNVTHIGISAFSNVPNLATIDLPNTLTTIASSAFSGCTQLSQISIPASVTSKGPNAFPQGVHVVLADGRTQIQSFLFRNESKISEISIPSSVINIGQNAFDNCTNLTAVTFLGTSKLKTIGASAFSRCMKLTQFTLPASVTTIGNLAFETCTNLRLIEISNNVTSIGEKAFDGCEKLLIHAKPNSKPSGWAVNWNSSNKTVIWNYADSEWQTTANGMLQPNFVTKVNLEICILTTSTHYDDIDYVWYSIGTFEFVGSMTEVFSITGFNNPVTIKIVGNYLKVSAPPCYEHDDYYEQLVDWRLVSGTVIEQYPMGGGWQTVGNGSLVADAQTRFNLELCFFFGSEYYDDGAYSWYSLGLVEFNSSSQISYLIPYFNSTVTIKLVGNTLSVTAPPHYDGYGNYAYLTNWRLASGTVIEQYFTSETWHVAEDGELIEDVPTKLNLEVCFRIGSIHYDDENYYWYNLGSFEFTGSLTMVFTVTNVNSPITIEIVDNSLVVSAPSINDENGSYQLWAGWRLASGTVIEQQY